MEEHSFYVLRSRKEGRKGGREEGREGRRGYIVNVVCLVSEFLLIQQRKTRTARCLVSETTEQDLRSKIVNRTRPIKILFKP